MATDRLEACKLQSKSRLHESKAAYGRLQAAHFETQATSHDRLCDCHWLMAQRYRLKLETVSDSTLHPNYELKVRYHLLQAEQHRERYIHSCQMVIEHGRKAEAHEMLSDYLQHKVAKIQSVEE